MASVRNLICAALVSGSVLLTLMGTIMIFSDAPESLVGNIAGVPSAGMRAPVVAPAPVPPGASYSDIDHCTCVAARSAAVRRKLIVDPIVASVDGPATEVWTSRGAPAPHCRRANTHRACHPAAGVTNTRRNAGRFRTSGASRMGNAPAIFTPLSLTA